MIFEQTEKTCTLDDISMAYVYQTKLLKDIYWRFPTIVGQLRQTRSDRSYHGGAPFFFSETPWSEDVYTLHKVHFFRMK